MLGIICLIGSAFFILIAICLIIMEIEEPGSYGGSALIGFIVFVIVLFLNFLPISQHIYDLSTIRTAEAFIEVRQEAIDTIEKEIKNIPETPQFFNADSPMKTYIETKSQYIKDITEQKIQIEQAKKNILAREMGTGGWVVWLFGTE